MSPSYSVRGKKAGMRLRWTGINEHLGAIKTGLEVKEGCMQREGRALLALHQVQREGWREIRASCRQSGQFAQLAGRARGLRSCLPLPQGRSNTGEVAGIHSSRVAQTEGGKEGPCRWSRRTGGWAKNDRTLGAGSMRQWPEGDFPSSFLVHEPPPPPLGRL